MAGGASKADVLQGALDLMGMIHILLHGKV